MKILATLILFTTISAGVLAQDTTALKIFTVAEVLPQFPGGDAALVQYLGDHIHYPSAAITNNTVGTVVIQFVINTDGSVTDIKVLRGVVDGCTEEAMRVVAGMPKWQPGMNKGKPVPVYFNLPIVFQLQEDDTKPTTADAPTAPAVSEEQAIQDYITQHNLHGIKTASGLYYVTDVRGKRTKVKPGKKVSVKYTGSFLNGKVFDSNVDSDFNHTQPFIFLVGQGDVIKGWDEGLQLFNVGGKGKLIIPSALAYGTNGAGSSIAPNTPLVFDIEVLKVK